MQARGERLIMVGVDIGKDTSLQRSLRRWSTPEVMKIALETSAVEANNRFRKR